MITAGLPRKPGMSRMDLLEVNAKIVRQVAENVAKYAPNAVVIVVSNPLDEMTALAQLATGFPKNRVLGQAGVLDTARFTNFVAEELGVPVRSVKTLTLGSHGDTMVPVPSQCTVDGKPLRRRDAGREDRGAGRRAPATAAPRWSRCSRPARPTTRRRPPPPGWPRPSPRTPARSCRSAPGSTASTASPASTWVSQAELGAERRQARSSRPPLTDAELAALKEAAEAVRAKQADVASI